MDEVDGDGLGNFTYCGLVVELDATSSRRKGHRTIHRAGIEVMHGESPGDRSSDGRLARPGRSVDGYDH